MRRTLLLTSSLATLLSATSTHAGGPLFEDGEVLPAACGPGDGCWTNYMRVTDLDGDHQLDAVMVNMQGFFSVGAGEALVIYRNEPAGTLTNFSAEAIADHVGRHRQVAIGDVDADGDPDIYAPEAAGDADSLFLNNGDGTFEETILDVGSEAGAARFGDLDDDGDLDLFLTHGYPDSGGPVSPAARVWINDGAGVFTELADATPPEVAGSQPIDVDLFDADGDFDLDALIDTHDGPIPLWLNNGDGTFVEGPALANANGLHYGPGVCDVDGDGDLDFWVDNAGPDNLEQLHINDGTATFSEEAAARVMGNIGGGPGDDNGVVCTDFDYDGDFDAVVVALNSPERWLENDGTGNFVYVPGIFPGVGDDTLWMEFGDLNNDGRLDLVTGSGEGNTIDSYFIGSKVQMVDTTGPAFRATEQIASPVGLDTTVVLHYAITDNTTTDEGPRLNRAFVQVSVDGGDATEVDARFSGGDMFRAELPGQASGSIVSYTVCAEDWAGNEACGDALEYELNDIGGTSGGVDTGNETETAGGSADTSGSASATGASATGTASASATATAGDTDDGSGGSDGGQDDSGGGGCGCTQDRAPTGGMLAGFGLVLIALRRRR